MKITWCGIPMYVLASQEGPSWREFSIECIKIPGCPEFDAQEFLFCWEQDEDFRMLIADALAREYHRNKAEADAERAYWAGTDPTMNGMKPCAD